MWPIALVLVVLWWLNRDSSSDVNTELRRLSAENPAAAAALNVMMNTDAATADVMAATSQQLRANGYPHLAAMVDERAVRLFG